MEFFTKLSELIPFEKLGTIGSIVVVALLITGFLIYQAQKTNKTKRVLRAKVSEDAIIDNSDVGRIASKENSYINVKVHKGASITNSKVGEIED